MPEDLEIPIKLTETDKAEKTVEGLRTSARKFFNEIKKADEETAKAIRDNAAGALASLSGVTAGLGGQLGAHGFQQAQVQLGRNVANSLEGVGSGIGGALGTAFGPAGTIVGSKLGGLLGGFAGGALNREIDLAEIPRDLARQRIAQYAGMAARFGTTFSDEAIQRAVKFVEPFERRAYGQERRVLDLQIWR